MACILESGGGIATTISAAIDKLCQNLATQSVEDAMRGLFSAFREKLWRPLVGHETLANTCAGKPRLSKQYARDGQLHHDTVHVRAGGLSIGSTRRSGTPALRSVLLATRRREGGKTRCDRARPGDSL